MKTTSNPFISFSIRPDAGRTLVSTIPPPWWRQRGRMMHKPVRTVIAAAALAAAFCAWMPVKADITYYTPPKFKHRVLPAYPDSARAAHETGSAVVKVLVAADGTAKQYILFRSSGHKDLDDAVMAAVKASTYAPAERGSTPVIGFYDVTYKFTLQGLAEDEGNQSSLAAKVQANPNDVNTRILLGESYLNAKNYSAAEQVFEDGTKATPDNSKVWEYLGLSYYQDGANNNNDLNKYKSAVDAYDKALSLSPHLEVPQDAADAYFNYGFQLQQNDDYNDALTYAKKAVALQPKSFQYYILLCEVQSSLNDYSDAVASAKQAETLDDHKNTQVSARVVADLGQAELALGDKADGMADLARSKQVDPQAPWAYEYEYTYDLKNNRTDALKPLAQLELLPTQAKNPQWPVAAGNIYLGENNLAQAKAEFAKAAAINPNDPNVLFGDAEVAAASGDSNGVDTTMQKLAAAVSQKQAAVYESSIAILMINASQGGKSVNLGDAQKYAQQATVADATNGMAWFALGYAQAQQHQTDDAKNSILKAYGIFKAQNDQDHMKQASDLYKNLTGSDISGS
jgi:TonB family protein